MQTRVRARTQKYVVLIAFPRQQWLPERASILTFIRTLPVFLELSLFLFHTIGFILLVQWAYFVC